MGNVQRHSCDCVLMPNRTIHNQSFFIIDQSLPIVFLNSCILSTGVQNTCYQILIPRVAAFFKSFPEKYIAFVILFLQHG